MATRQRSGAKEQFWRDVLVRHSASGLSGRAFCRQQKLGEASFYAWRRTIAERDAGSERSQAAPPRAEPTVKPNPQPKRRRAAPAFVPAVVTGQATPGVSITIELAGGRVMRLPESTATARLVELVLALEAGAAR